MVGNKNFMKCESSKEFEDLYIYFYVKKLIYDSPDENVINKLPELYFFDSADNEMIIKFLEKNNPKFYKDSDIEAIKSKAEEIFTRFKDNL